MKDAIELRIKLVNEAKEFVDENINDRDFEHLIDERLNEYLDYIEKAQNDMMELRKKLIENHNSGMSFYDNLDSFGSVLYDDDLDERCVFADVDFGHLQTTVKFNGVNIILPVEAFVYDDMGNKLLELDDLMGFDA